LSQIPREKQPKEARRRTRKMLESWDGEIDWGIDEREEWEAKVSAGVKVIVNRWKAYWSGKSRMKSPRCGDRWFFVPEDAVAFSRMTAKG
jgi:hypothetical protein